ncbi:hypothetical protein PUN28_009783 [Cardiocondyla obscurior]|uniref:YqaJ viral recombinase domain-containing protein n=1 Tax=Cardiocondyla obscurior TaxID=286306 RepID=A0AAW2FMS9_9HYME
MCDSVPPVIKKLETRRQIKVARSSEYRQTKPKSKKFKKQAGTDCDYSPQWQKPDFPSDVVEQLRQYHVEQLLENANNSDVIEIKELAVKLNKKIKLCRLFIDNENPCLSASPDGLIDEDGIVKIKCPM